MKVKSFVISARDAEEREQWIEALENTILRHSRHSSFRVGSFL